MNSRIFKWSVISLLSAFSIPYLFEAQRTLNDIFETCGSNINLCKENQVLLSVYVLRIVVCMLAIIVILKNTKFIRLAVWINVLVSLGFWLIYEYFVIGSIGELLNIRILMFKYMLKFENIEQSIYYLWFYFLNPGFLFALVLLDLKFYHENNQ